MDYTVSHQWNFNLMHHSIPPPKKEIYGGGSNICKYKFQDSIFNFFALNFILSNSYSGIYFTHHSMNFLNNIIQYHCLVSSLFFSCLILFNISEDMFINTIKGLYLDMCWTLGNFLAYFFFHIKLHNCFHQLCIPKKWFYSLAGEFLLILNKLNDWSTYSVS